MQRRLLDDLLAKQSGVGFDEVPIVLHHIDEFMTAVGQNVDWRVAVSHFGGNVVVVIAVIPTALLAIVDGVYGAPFEFQS